MNKRRTRRHRRRAKAMLRDKRAVRPHRRVGGRTGQIMVKKLKGLKAHRRTAAAHRSSIERTRSAQRKRTNVTDWQRKAAEAY